MVLATTNSIITGASVAATSYAVSVVTVLSPVIAVTIAWYSSILVGFLPSTKAKGFANVIVTTVFVVSVVSTLVVGVNT